MKYKKFFTVHTINGKSANKVLQGKTGRYGMAPSSGPSGVARKAYTEILRKLGMNKNNNKKNGKENGLSKICFTIREITSNNKKKVYGPYIGTREKIPDDILEQDEFLKKYKITHRSYVKLNKKKCK